MKIGITGHSKNLGKFLFDYYSIDHDVIGFSRSNGYDINDPSNIIERSKDLDLFINNTYSGVSQIILTEQIECDMIVMGSEVANLAPDYRLSSLSYYYNKRKLKETCNKLSKTDRNILHLTIPFLENGLDKHNLNPKIVITYTEIAETIDFWLKNKNFTNINYKYQL